LDDPEK
jgi:hypothetical protein